MQGSKPPNKKEKEHMDKVQQLGCIVCKLERGIYSPAEIHHIVGKTKRSHMRVLPLCYRHHREGGNNELFASRHPYKICLLYTSPSPRDLVISRMPSSA